MPVTNADIQAFTEFALVQVSSGKAESMPQLLEKWLDARESEHVVDAVTKGESEIARGGGKLVDQAFADIRKELGWDE